jgi:hypothetical protein
MKGKGKKENGKKGFLNYKKVYTSQGSLKENGKRKTEKRETSFLKDLSFTGFHSLFTIHNSQFPFSRFTSSPLPSCMLYGSKLNLTI